MTLSDARKRAEESKAERSFAPLGPDRELGTLIHFWKGSLAEHRLLMSPSVIYLVEQTIKSLEKLLEIYNDGCPERKVALEKLRQKTAENSKY